MQYGSEWREHRRLAHSVLNSESVKQYENLKKEHIIMLLRSLISAPKSFDDQLRL
jgi:cytochrome P450